MITKRSTVVATLAASVAVVLGSFGVANAEDASSKAGIRPSVAPASITPASHNIATRGGKLDSGGLKADVAGWNYVHATNCVGYWDGTNTWLYVYPQEGGYWFTNNLVLQNVLEPQCALGNWVAFHVYNTNGNLWNQVYTFPYK